MNDFGGSLARLEAQREDGQITDEEYRELRSHLLNRRDKGSKRLAIGVTLVILLVVVVVVVTTL